MMKIQIRGHKVPVAEVLRTHVERRLGLALGRFGVRIGRVIVRFSQIGPENRCEIDVSLRPRSVRVADTAADPFAAVDHATDRASGSVDRALEREREWQERES